MMKPSLSKNNSRGSYFFHQVFSVTCPNRQQLSINFYLTLIISTHIGQSKTDYIEGSTNGQPKRLKTAFHPDLNLYYVKNDKVATWSGDAYIDDTKEGQPTGESGKILSIDYENNAAVAKVEISHPKSPTPYIDYFMLLKTGGKWTIIHKMFTKKTSVDKGGNR